MPHEEPEPVLQHGNPPIPLPPRLPLLPHHPPLRPNKSQYYRIHKQNIFHFLPHLPIIHEEEILEGSSGEVGFGQSGWEQLNCIFSNFSVLCEGSGGEDEEKEDIEEKDSRINNHTERNENWG